MKKIVCNALLFTVGAAIGSTVTWKIVEAKYKRIADEEIESVKETFAKRYKENKNTDEPAEEPEDENEPVPFVKKYEQYKQTVADLGYSSKEEGGVNNMLNSKPHIIEPDEFGETFDYSTVSLTHYEDGVLTDEDDEIIEETDIEGMVGKDYFTHFGEYEDDSVFIRNDYLKTDYEILRDYRNYRDVHPSDPEE